MEYQVILDDFQGPLDLLLHLIKEKEMDLQTLELSVITDQYLQYIHMMESSQLEVMSEYLVMAAQLIEMKSKMLLPKEKVQIEDEYQEDPREALIRRLIEYKRYKDVLDEIQEKYEKRQSMLIKPSNNMEEYVIDTSTMIPKGLEVYDLMKAMQKMYQRKMLSRPLDTHISKKDISIEQRSDQIRNYFKVRVNKRVKLDELFETYAYDARQKTQLRLADEKGLDISKMKDPRFNWEQMREISLAMEYGLNPDTLCDPEINAESMEKIRYSLMDQQSVFEDAKEEIKKKRTQRISLTIL